MAEEEGGVGKMPIWGEETAKMNMEPVLWLNIQQSAYFKYQCYELKTFHQVIDEIYYKVDTLEPFIGATRNPTTAFCLLYKLFTLKLTFKQMRNLTDHTDSPYIRAIGFLYLRYTFPPQRLWNDWFQYYVEDEEPIAVRGEGKGKPITIGKFCRELLKQDKFFETRFPRIPVPVLRDIERKLEPIEKAAKEAKEKEKETVFAKETTGGVGNKPPDRDPSELRKMDREQRERYRERERERERGSGSGGDRDRDSYRDRDRKDRDRDRRRSSRSRSRDRDRKRSRSRDRSRSPKRRRSPSPRGSSAPAEDKKAPPSAAALARMKAIQAMYGSTSSEPAAGSDRVGRLDTLGEERVVVGGASKKYLEVVKKNKPAWE